MNTCGEANEKQMLGPLESQQDWGQVLGRSGVWSQSLPKSIWWGGVCVCVSGLICWVWIFEDRGVLYCKRKTPSASQNAISKLQSLPWGKTKLPIALIRGQKLMKKVLRLLKGKNYWWLFSRRHKWLGAFFRASLSRISFLFLLELAYRGSKSLWELVFCLL